MRHRGLEKDGAAPYAFLAPLIALLALAYRFTKLSRVGLFWAAFVLTRPFGATLGDVLTKSHQQGGLGFGTIGSSAVLLAVLALLVAREASRKTTSVH